VMILALCVTPSMLSFLSLSYYLKLITSLYEFCHSGLDPESSIRPLDSG
jgi:hypothetical protein